MAKKYRDINLPLAIALNVLLVAVASWWSSLGAPWPAVVMPLTVVCFVLTFVGPALIRSWWHRRSCRAKTSC